MGPTNPLLASAADIVVMELKEKAVAITDVIKMADMMVMEMVVEVVVKEKVVVKKEVAVMMIVAAEGKGVKA